VGVGCWQVGNVEDESGHAKTGLRVRKKSEMSEMGTRRYLHGGDGTGGKC
jgi:hypothetical protein